jgi:hypothetical protein
VFTSYSIRPFPLKTTKTIVPLQGFPRTIVDAVLGVTRRDDEPYEEFVRRASLNPISK